MLMQLAVRLYSTPINNTRIMKIVYSSKSKYVFANPLNDKPTFLQKE